jgi:hypothetical protein
MHGLSAVDRTEEVSEAEALGQVCVQRIPARRRRRRPRAAPTGKRSGRNPGRGVPTPAAASGHTDRRVLAHGLRHGPRRAADGRRATTREEPRRGSTRLRRAHADATAARPRSAFRAGPGRAQPRHRRCSPRRRGLACSDARPPHRASTP